MGDILVIGDKSRDARNNGAAGRGRVTRGIGAGLAGLILGMAVALTGLQAGTAQAQPAPIDIGAKQAFLMDATTGTVLYAKNADQPMVPSSMTKMMTVYLVFEKLAKGDLKLDDTFPVSERAWRQGGSKMFVKLNTRVSVNDLLQGVIVQSGNDACIVLAEGIAGSEPAFAELMNRKAKALGMTHTTFKNSDGWPEDGHLTTAHDLGLLAYHLIKDFPQDYHYFSEIDFTYNGIKQGNRNPLLYKNIGVDGLKTGHTEAGGYGLTASAKRGDRRLIAVLNGMTSVNERSQDSDQLLDWGFREFNNYTLFKQGQTVEQAEVWLGQAAVVPLVAKQDVVLTLPRSAHDGVKVTVKYTGPVPAPIQKGAPLATLAATAPGLSMDDVPLYAGADVGKLGAFGRVRAALTQLILGSPKQ